jgi:hypothetical protein
VERVGIVVQHHHDWPVGGFGEAGAQPIDLDLFEHAIGATRFGGIEHDDAVALGIDDLVDLASRGVGIAISEDIEEGRAVVVIAQRHVHRDGQPGDDGLEPLIGGRLAMIGQVAVQNAEIGVAVPRDHGVHRLFQPRAGIERHRCLARRHQMQVTHHDEFQGHFRLTNTRSRNGAK